MRNFRILYLLFIAGMFSAMNSFSQQSKFKITYSVNNNAEWAFSSLYSDTTLVVNASYEAPSGFGILLLNLSSAGTVNDLNTFTQVPNSYSGSWAGSLLLIDTNLYVGGDVLIPNPNNPLKNYSYPSLVKFSLALDSVWSKYFKIDTNYIYSNMSCLKTLDGNIILYGKAANRFSNFGKWDFYIVKVDTAGNMIWHKRYGALGSDERCASVNEFTDGRLLISGVIFNGTGTIATPWVFITDPSGIIQWQKTYTQPALQWGGGFTKIGKTTGFFLQGATDTIINPGDYPNVGYLAKLNSNGDFIWKTIFNSPWFTQIWDYYELNNGNIVFCGDKKDSGTGKQYGYIAQVDSNGILRWWHTYHEYPNRDNYLTSIRPAPDGGFVATGSTFSLPNGASQDAWIIKTDSLGCATLNCTLSVAYIDGLQKGIKVYPNPASNQFIITEPLSLVKAGTSISVFDAFGKTVYKKLLTENTKSVEIKTDDWASGIYLVVLAGADGKRVSERLVVEK
jgi:hypothetical protein